MYFIHTFLKCYLKIQPLSQNIDKKKRNESFKNTFSRSFPFILFTAFIFENFINYKSNSTKIILMHFLTVPLSSVIINFFIHFYEHKYKFLWKFHKIHHQIKNVETKNGFHSHSLEYLILTYILPFTSNKKSLNIYLIFFSVFSILGCDIFTIFISLFLQTLSGILDHCEFSIPILVGQTKRHHIHHIEYCIFINEYQINH